MNLCIFVVILTLSSLLPVMAAEIKAKDADTGSVKCSNNGGECVFRNDTQKCLVPLEEKDNDCPKGEQCCKRQVTDISVKKSRGCKQDKNCKSAGGFCTKSKKCKKVQNHALCTGKKCTCCLGIRSVIPQGDSGIKSMIDTRNGNDDTWIPTGIYKLRYYSVVVPEALMIERTLCPVNSVHMTYDIPEFQKYDSTVMGITCTDNQWILDQTNEGKNCRFVLKVDTNWGHYDHPEWYGVEKPYYEAMRNCLTYSCVGMSCMNTYDKCWLKTKSPEQDGSEPYVHVSVTLWRPVCE